MREFRLKPFRPKAAAGASRSDGLTEEQHKALMVEFDRRIAGFREKWRVCRIGRCRRGRQCLGSPVVCGDYFSPWKNREYRRLRRDIVRKPPQIKADSPKK